VPVARVKLVTPWYGEPPKFYGRFRERVAANRVVEHELIPVKSYHEMNSRAARAVTLANRAPTRSDCCRKGSNYAACCDLKPLFGDMFALSFAGYEWWGRCDLDVVFGDLDRLLPPLLDYYDGYNPEPHVMSGSFWMFRNNETTRKLWRSSNWSESLREGSYTHFDHASGEAEASNDVVVADRWGLSVNPPNADPRMCGGFTGAVARSGIKMCWDDRSWDEGRCMVNGRPSRVPCLVGNRLIEMPTGRELVVYSLGSGEWPLL
jgi:hypothetical protein